MLNLCLAVVMTAGIFVGMLQYFSLSQVFIQTSFLKQYLNKNINIVFGKSTRGYTAAQMSSAALHSHLPDSDGCNRHPLFDSDLLGEHEEESTILHCKLNSFVCRALLQLLLAHCRWENMMKAKSLKFS